MSGEVGNATLESIASGIERAAPAGHRLPLSFGAQRLDVVSNSPTLLEWLRDYLAPFDGGDHARSPDLVVSAHQMDPPDLGLVLREWPREPGKQNQKEAFADLPDGRVVRKVRTGMQFLVGPKRRVAFGDCLAQPNQVVNFVDFQYIAYLMNQGLALCHAAGVASPTRGLGLAGMAGGGKSTLALHLVSAGYSFTSNDRLLVGPQAAGAVMKGVPKHPRINPGTALSNPDLVAILSEVRREALARLPRESLWALEEKYDAEIDRLFGPGRITLDSRIDAFLILAWSPRDASAARFDRVDLSERRDLLAAVMKSPGPFFLPERGPWPQGFESPSPDFYLEKLKGIPIYEARGGVDFARGVAFARELLGSPPARLASPNR